MPAANTVAPTGSAPAPATVEAVRSFNRFYTAILGLLREGFLSSDRSLAEVRVIFELAQGGETELSDLRESLGLDGGYVSRLIARLEAAGLVARTPSEADRRRQLLRLTDAGREAFADFDRRASAQVAGLLDGLRDEQQRRLGGAMATVRELLGDRRDERALIVLRRPEAGELGWIVARHGALYAEEYGWDERFEALVARIVADFLERADGRERAWIAELGGVPVGCVLCTRKSDAVAQLRLLLVEPEARGMGIGGRLVGECLAFARGAGYERISLWTNDVLAAARRIYERAGFELEAEEPHRSFGAEVVGQTWSRAL